MMSIVIALSMLALDGLWITCFMGALYQQHLGAWMQVSEGYRLIIGLVAVYGLMLLGLFTFVLQPGVSLIKAIMFGGVLYGVFALTNYVVFSNWAIELVVADIAWGCFLFGALWSIAQFIGYIN